jgi:hypothetical protein
VEDLYVFDYGGAGGRFVRDAAIVQAGHGSLGASGKVYMYRVNLDSDALSDAKGNLPTSLLA